MCKVGHMALHEEDCFRLYHRVASVVRNVHGTTLAVHLRVVKRGPREPPHCNIHRPRRRERPSASLPDHFEEILGPSLPSPHSRCRENRHDVGRTHPASRAKILSVCRC